MKLGRKRPAEMKISIGEILAKFFTSAAQLRWYHRWLLFGAKLYIRTFKSNSLKSSFRLSGRFFCWKRKNCKSWCEERVKNSSFKLMPCDCEPLSHVLFFFSLQNLCVRREHILLSGNSKHLTGQWRPALVVVICPTFTGGGLFSKTIEGVR